MAFLLGLPGVNIAPHIKETGPVYIFAALKVAILVVHDQLFLSVDQLFRYATAPAATLWQGDDATTSTTRGLRGTRHDNGVNSAAVTLPRSTVPSSTIT